jgi:hypothetical protein
MNNILSLVNTEEFEDTLINHYDNKKWLFHPRQLSVEKEHQDKVIKARARLNIKTNQYHGSRFQSSPKRFDFIYDSSSQDYRLQNKVEFEGNRFYKKHGRWPNNDETIQIVNRIKFNTGPEKTDHIQAAKEYFYRRNGRWPNEDEYKNIISSLSKT